MHSLLVSLSLALTLAMQALPAQAQAQVSSRQQPVLDRIRATGRITLAHRESSVPFSYLDASGKPVGYALDLCLHMADAVKNALGLRELTVAYLPVTPQNRIEAITRGRADLECGSTTNNAERRTQVAFTVPHYVTGVRYLVRSDSPVLELAQFEGRKLVSTKGTTALDTVVHANHDRLLHINVLEAPDHRQAMEMVERGQADGFAMDDVLLYGMIASHPHPELFKVVGKFLTIEPLAIMMGKDDAAFKRIVDDEMKRLIRTREAQAIYERWFGRPIPPQHVALNLPMHYLLKDFWKYPTDVVPF